MQAGLTYWGGILQATSKLGRQWFHVHHICWEGINPDVLQGKVCSRTGVGCPSWHAHAFEWQARQAPVGSSEGRFRTEIIYEQRQCLRYLKGQEGCRQICNPSEVAECPLNGCSPGTSWRLSCCPGSWAGSCTLCLS